MKFPFQGLPLLVLRICVCAIVVPCVMCLVPPGGLAQIGTVSDPTSSMFPNEAPGPDAILVPEPEIGRKFILIGKTRVPFGTLVRLQGVVFEGDGKGSESGSNMFIESIDGKTCQERIALESLYHGGLHLQNGKRYELVGYESGGFTGIPFQARAALVSLIQSDDFHFHTTFFVLNEKLLEEK